MNFNYCLNNNLIIDAIDHLRNQALAYPEDAFFDRIENVRTEFFLMSKYFLNGTTDPQRTEMFEGMKKKLTHIDYDIRVRDFIANTPMLNYWHRTITQTDTSFQSLCTMDDMDKAFHALILSPHWKSEDMERWTEYLAQGGIRQAVFIAAITISCMQTFSYEKLMCLARIFNKSTDETIRQRAFTGCILALTLHRQSYIVNEKDEILKELLSNDNAVQQLIELQMQAINCTQANIDSDKINNTIMPDIIKNQPFTITKNGIVEREENDEDGIDSYSADEKSIEELENNIRKVQKMQQQGSDIFFGGFKQMKRYPFFNKNSNWLMPFTADNPELNVVREKLNNSKFIDRVVNRGPFCDSDKYSFVFAMADVIGQFSDKVRELMEEGDLGPIGMNDDISVTLQPAYIRRQYLQDLYRFYSINSLAKTLTNPFEYIDDCEAWLISLQHMSVKHILEIGKFLLKHNNDTTLYDIINSYPKQSTPELDYLSAEMYLHEAERIKNDDSIPSDGAPQFREAAEYFKDYLYEHQNHIPSLRGCAKAYYNIGEYKKAAMYYDALRTLKPERLSYTMNYCVAMVREGLVEEVLSELYRLNYENPDDYDIANILGWALLYAEKPDKALSIYQHIPEEILVNDVSTYLNYVYAHFVTHCQLPKEKLNTDSSQREKLIMTEIMSDAPMLALYGLHEAEIAIMAHSL